ncbi:hypothetical protein [Pseudomonas sp. N040]|uniref:hypothetical protein n=1 Tax=Pseudomonas sp. N040 TaxID=2785325 RepID=UPI0018A2AF1B|nr:hypothetical protein [Pseudomonas sp. N040]MBF7731706.1 hypothetical protein [Pseudomonas sp. N040]MBW7015350.1 hypothetical protein [Pseudomonas sp. N040]
MKKSVVTLLLSTGLILAAGSPQAHEDAPQAPMHSGVVSEAASGTNAELSLEGGMLMVYLRTHDGAPIASQDSTAELTLLSAGKKQVVALLPSGDNSLMAQGSYQAGPGSKAVLKLSLPGKSTEQFRFELK